MDSIIRIGERGVIMLNVQCEDNEGIATRTEATEVRLPTDEQGGACDLILTLRLGGVCGDTPKQPLDRQGIHQIELRIAKQEYDPDAGSGTISQHAIKHIFRVEPKRIATDSETYNVTHWKAFVDGRKIKDIRAGGASVIDMDACDMTAAEQKEVAENMVIFIENDTEAGVFRIVIPKNPPPSLTKEQRAEIVKVSLADFAQKEL